MKNLNYVLISLVAFVILASFVNAQKNMSLTKTTETIVDFKFSFPIIKGRNSLTPIGYLNESIIYKFDDYSNWSTKFFLLNENNFEFSQILGTITDSKRMFFFNSLDSIIFYREAFYNNDVGYLKIFLVNKFETYEIDSIFNADKKIHSSFSSDGKYLIVNTLNTLSDYYNPEQDNRIMVYSLENIKNGKINKIYIPCTHCADGYLVGDDFFFTKSNQQDDYSGGFAWKDIYKAPWGKLQDSIKIAAFSEILAISPDGKYILGTRHFDLPNSPCAIFDVENKKYQLLLGRNYSKAHAFYSFKNKKFAFDFSGRIVYIDFPKKYPFDALRRGNPDIPNWSETEFYKSYQHEPFK